MIFDLRAAGGCQQEFVLFQVKIYDDLIIKTRCFYWEKDKKRCSKFLSLFGKTMMFFIVYITVYFTYVLMTYVVKMIR